MLRFGRDYTLNVSRHVWHSIIMQNPVGYILKCLVISPS